MHRQGCAELEIQKKIAGQQSAGIFKERGEEDMMMEDILYELREVEAGHRLLHRPLAKQAADALELMVDRVRYLDEKVKAAGE